MLDYDRELNFKFRRKSQCPTIQVLECDGKECFFFFIISCIINFNCDLSKKKNSFDQFLGRYLLGLYLILYNL